MLGVNEVFASAHNEFLSALTKEEQALFKPCHSAKELMEDVEKLNIFSENKTKGHRIISSVAAFSKSLEPYFEVLTIFTSSNPKYTALVLGSLRLVLQLASNFTTFFEKLSRTLSELSLKFPRYTELYELCRDHKGQALSSSATRLQSSLIRVYLDLFTFMQGIVQIFTKANGHRKSRMRIAAKMAWKPYDNMFQDMLQQLEFHATVLKEDCALHLFQVESHHRTISSTALKAQTERDHRAEHQAIERYKAMSDILKDIKTEMNQTAQGSVSYGDRLHESVLERSRAWLDPPDFAFDLEQADDRREDDTASWLAENHQFHEWHTASSFPLLQNDDRFGPNVFWVRGNPGCGKTILAAATVRFLQAQYGNPCEETRPVYYYFFRGDDPCSTSSLAAHRALAAQILQSHQGEEKIINTFQFAMRNTMIGQRTASHHEIRDLFEVSMQSIGRSYLVLDGFDECTETEAVIKTLKRITKNPDCRVIIFSRPAGHSIEPLSHCFAKDQPFDIGKAISDDIELFLRRGVHELVSNGKFRANVNTSDLIRHLHRGADGMFLWADLMLKYLRSPAFTPAQRVRVVLAIANPEKLDFMFDRIMGEISKANSHERSLAWTVFLWLSRTKSELNEREVHEVFQMNHQPGLPQGVPTMEDLNEINDFGNGIIQCCSSLVERVVTTSREPRLRFVHLSLKDYFLRKAKELNGSAKNGPLRISINFSSSAVLDSCLRYLRDKLPMGPLSGDITSPIRCDQLEAKYPLGKYAGMHWIDHLAETLEHDATLEDTASRISQTIFYAERLLTSKFSIMAWLEVAYLYKRPPNTGKLREWSTAVLRHFEPYLSPQDLQVLRQFDELATYLEILHRDWGNVLLKEAACIWREVTAFTPSKFLGKTSEFQMEEFPTKRAALSRNVANHCLCKVSEVSEANRTMAILSIWPSKKFEEEAQRKRLTRIRPHNMEQFARGWTARYEVWSIDETQSTLVDLIVDLDPEMVDLHLRHGLVIDNVSWKTQFPIAISPDTAHFVVLNAIFQLRSSTREGAPDVFVKPLPFDPKSPLKAYWNRNSHEFRSFFEDNFQVELGKARFTYEYWMQFSPNGDYLFYIDQYVQGNNMVVFKIDKGLEFHIVQIRHALARKLCNIATPEQAGTDSEKPIVAFHPVYPVILFNGLRAVIWPFGYGDSTLRYAPHSAVSFSSEGKLLDSNGRFVEWLPPQLRSAPRPEDPLPHYSQVPSIEGKANRFWLTEDGQNKASSLEAMLATHTLQDQPDHCIPQNTPKQPSQLLTSPQPQDLIIPGIIHPQPGSVLRIGWNQAATNYKDSTTTSEHVSLTNNTVNIVSFSQSEGSAAAAVVTQLSRMPAWPGLRGAEPAVFWSRTRGEAVSIVLNKTVQRWNRPGQREDEDEEVRDCLPIVVRRDPVALVPRSRRVAFRDLLE